VKTIDTILIYAIIFCVVYEFIYGSPYEFDFAISMIIVAILFIIYKNL